MGWQTDCKAEIIFNRETYNSLYAVDDDLEKANKFINDCKHKLLIMASTDPKNLIQKDCEGIELSLIDSITSELNNILEWYEENLIDKIKLEFLQEYWYTRDGDFVEHDKYVKYIGETNFAFIKGKIYGANKHKDYSDIYFYVFGEGYYPCKIKESFMDSMFEESSYQDWHDQDWSSFKHEVKKVTESTTK